MVLKIDKVILRHQNIDYSRKIQNKTIKDLLLVIELRIQVQIKQYLRLMINR